MCLKYLAKFISKHLCGSPFFHLSCRIQKQPPRGVFRKSCSENMQRIYRRTPWQSVISIKLQSNFIEIKFWHGCSPVNLLHIFRKPFSQNTSKRLLLRYRPICNFVKKKTPAQMFSYEFCKKKIFRENALLQMFDWVLNTPYPLAGIGRKS